MSRSSLGFAAFLGLLWPLLSTAQLPPSPTEIKRQEAERRAAAAEKRAAEAEAKLKALQAAPQQQYSPNNPPPDTAKPGLLHGRYQVLGNGSEVKDVKTGLVWARCSVGQSWSGQTCAGEAKTFNLDDAQRQAPPGWRVPTIRELASLIHCSSGKTKDLVDLPGSGPKVANTCTGNFSSPTLRGDVFPNTPETGWYWSSSPYAGYTSVAWVVNFSNGGVNDYARDGSNAVRLVRASQ